MPSSPWLPLGLTAWLLAGTTCTDRAAPPTPPPPSQAATSQPKVERRLAEMAKAKAAAGQPSNTYTPLARNLKPGQATFEWGKGGRWEDPTPESQTAATERLRKIRTFPSDDEASDLIHQAANDATRDLIALVTAALDHTSAAIRAEALESLAAFSDKEAIPPLILRGLSDIDEAVRLAALSGALGLNSEALLPILETALTNSSLDVRENALDLAQELHESDYRRLLMNAANGTHLDLATRALAELEHVIAKRSLPQLFPFLTSPHSEVKEAAQLVLEARLGRSFANATEASQWWTQNANRFDDDLVEIDAAP
jgi:3-dehydroquinate dehydratase